MRGRAGVSEGVGEGVSEGVGESVSEGVGHGEGVSEVYVCVCFKVRIQCFMSTKVSF